MGRSAALAPLRDRRFAWFFAGRLVSTSGSDMAPIAVAFAVLAIGGSPVALGQVLAARGVTMVVFLLVGGVVADRLPRSTVLVASHLGSFLTQGVAAYLVISGRAHVGHLVLIEALNGVMTAFTMPAISGLVPQVVDRRYLQQANALLSFSRSGLAIVGPAVAGTLVVTVGPGWALAFDAATWLIAGICMLFVPVPRLENEGGSSPLASLRSGWKVFTSFTWLWTVVVACGILNALYAGAWSTLGPVIAKSTPRVGEQGWGFAVSAQAVGLLVVTLVMVHVRPRHPLRAGMMSMLALVLPLVTLATGASLALLLAASFLAGAGIGVFMILWQTAIHENIPERHLSRISAFDALGSFVAIPVGQLAVGPVNAVIGPTRTLLGASLLFLVVVVATLGLPAVRGTTRGPGSAPAPGRSGTGAAAAHRCDVGGRPAGARRPSTRRPASESADL